ncbi:hypothetical protein V1520DRAFT_359870 [Lipomyces starkeyi]|uniref:DUF4185 domain-containing protein n=1 Tax=Lipomyces starkeyi NRRL Y-11557 TaxID=675824 RepID=A0A1E3QA00_LIPST|nr:hypothetical protein LIPSTDRAFT_2444 [Lipomyces starkeyi NRRL Y-11557]
MSEGRLPLKVKAFERLGTLTDENGHNYTRDIGCSSVIGGVPFWKFGDTFPLNSNGQMIGLLTSTCAVGNVRNPVKCRYWNCDRDGRPPQFIPFTDEESKFNREHQHGGKKRFYLWSFSKIAETSPGEGFVFFHKGRTETQQMKDNVGYGIQIAKIKLSPDKSKLIATRLMNEPFFRGGVLWGSFDTVVDHDYVYLYGSQDGHIYCARVPKNRMTEKSAYEFWNKDRWTKDESQKSELFWKLQSGSVFWSQYYKCFVMVGCTMWADNKIIMRSAPRPEGPWTNDTLLYQLYKPQSGINYCVNAHPWAFPESNGGQLLVSWTDQHTGVVELAKVTWEGYEGKWLGPTSSTSVTGAVMSPMPPPMPSNKPNDPSQHPSNLNQQYQYNHPYQPPQPYQYSQYPGQYPQQYQPYPIQYQPYAPPQQSYSWSSPPPQGSGVPSPAPPGYLPQPYNHNNGYGGGYYNDQQGHPQVPYWSKPR